MLLKHTSKISAVCGLALSLLVTHGVAQATPKDPTLSPKVYGLAIKAYREAQQQGIKDNKHLLTIVDYSLPSSAKRMWVINTQTNRVLYHTLVSHGVNTGNVNAKSFSDRFNSRKSSIGLYRTKGVYYGHHGYSLKIAGLEAGYNKNAEARHIVVHSAPYVNETFAKKYGRIGRSWGCLALNPKVAKPIINTIKNGTLIFAYYPDKKWLATSQFLNNRV